MTPLVQNNAAPAPRQERIEELMLQLLQRFQGEVAGFRSPRQA